MSPSGVHMSADGALKSGQFLNDFSGHYALPATPRAVQALPLDQFRNESSSPWQRLAYIGVKNTQIIQLNFQFQFFKTLFELYQLKDTK